MTETELRATFVEDAIHSGEIEGLTVSKATSIDAELFIAGTIDSAELVERVRLQYGLAQA